MIRLSIDLQVRLSKDLDIDIAANAGRVGNLVNMHERLRKESPETHADGEASTHPPKFGFGI